MKAVLFRIITLLLLTNCFSQNFQGIAYYSSQTQMKEFNITSNDMTPQMKEQLMEKVKKGFEKTYILNFTNYESVYQEEEKLATPSPSSGLKVQMMFSGSNRSKLYKNFKTQQYISEEEILNKEFLVTDSLEKFKWVMVNEQKKIGNYNCYKALLIIPVTIEDRKEYEESKKKKEQGETNFIEISEPKEQIIEAWYTLDIPVSNGPGKYWGLPGLILELHEFNTTILCSKIVINPETKIEIKIPKAGKKVSQKEFDEIQEKKFKSMMNEKGAIEIKIN